MRLYVRFISKSREVAKIEKQNSTKLDCEVVYIEWQENVIQDVMKPKGFG